MKKLFFIVIVLFLLYSCGSAVGSPSYDKETSENSKAYATSYLEEGWTHTTKRDKLCYAYDPTHGILVRVSKQAGKKATKYHEDKAEGDLENGIYELYINESGQEVRTSYCWKKVKRGSSTWVVRMSEDGTYDEDNLYSPGGVGTAQSLLRQTTYNEDHPFDD